MSSLRPVAGTASRVLDLLRSWDASATEPEPLLIETSGSTGEPKRVALSRSALRASASATQERLGGPGQWLLNLPATYVAGVQVLFRSVLAGTEPVVQHDDLVSAASRLTAERRYVSLVPTQLSRMLDRPVEVDALRSFTTVLIGGAGLDPRLRRRSEQAGVRLVATYGMSETCGGCVYDGVPLDGVAVALDVDGRIRISGPVLFDGYDGAPELTEGVMRDGWFLTSDLGRFDDDGLLQVLGRIDDVVISGGVNVPAPAVAARLREHETVAEAEVVGVPDAEWGQRVVAAVVPTTAAHAPGLADLRDFVSARLDRTWAPRQLLLLDALPLLPNGKLDRRRLQQAAAQAGD